MTRPTWSARVLTAALAVALLWLAARHASWRQLAAIVRAADPGYLAAAILCVVTATLLRAWRWKLLLSTSPRFGRLWAVLLVGQAMNILAPFRAGDVTRVYVTGHVDGHGASRTFATIVIEKLLDAAALLLLLTAVSALLPLPPWLDRWRHTAALTSAAAAAAVVLATAVNTRPAAWIARLAASRTGRLRAALEDLADGLAQFSRLGTRSTLPPLALSLATWVVAALANWCVALALDMRTPGFAAAVVVLGAVQIGTGVVTTPGNIGVFEYMCVIALAAFSVGREAALAYGFLLHAVAYGPPLVLAAALMLRGMPAAAGAPSHERQPL